MLHMNCIVVTAYLEQLWSLMASIERIAAQNTRHFAMQPVSCEK